jgi:poly(A) polymerase
MELTTAVVIAAPHEVLAIAVPTMQKYCFDSLIRVSAHITILYPFVPFEELDSACALLREVCAGVQPFDITMNGYNHFPRVSYMQPLDDAPIRALSQKVFAAFPQCPPYWGQHGNNPTPHMTIGEFATDEEQAAAILPAYEPITFQASRLHVIYGVDQVPLTWLTHDVIRLGKG